MLVEHLGKDVAGGGRVAIGSKACGGKVGGGRQGAGVELSNEIAPMLRDAVFARDVPSSEAIGVRDAMTRSVGAKGGEAAAGGAWDDGFDDESGEKRGFGTRMAIHATAGAFNSGGAGFSGDIEDVKNPTELGVESDQFDPTTRDESEVKIIVEEEGTRIRGRDDAELETGRGKDPHLGRDGNLEQFEQAEDVSLFGRAIEIEFVGLEIVLEAGETILWGALAVEVGWGVDILERRFGLCGGKQGQTAERQSQSSADAEKDWGGGGFGKGRLHPERLDSCAGKGRGMQGFSLTCSGVSSERRSIPFLQARNPTTHPTLDGGTLTRCRYRPRFCGGVSSERRKLRWGANGGVI